jgi:hypothetical protein
MAGKKARGVHKVKTVSTFPPEGLFNRDAETIAQVMASKKVSPKGPGSGVRMIQFFINRQAKTYLPRGKRNWKGPSGFSRTRCGNGNNRFGGFR